MPASRRLALLLIVTFVCLAGAERGGRWLHARYVLPTKGAAWIWGPEMAEHGSPGAFYAARDFELADPLPARLKMLVQADEEYQLFLNGKWIGSGRYQHGAPLDEYLVEGIQRPGTNRLVVELRSSRGAGGLLLSLFRDASSEPLVVTDRSWHIYLHHLPGLLEGWRPLDGPTEAKVWEVPPTGRWGRPGERVSLPPLSERLQPGQGATRILPLHVALESLETDAAPEAGPEVDDTAFLVDFGESQVSFLELSGRFRAGSAQEVRLLEQLGELPGDPDVTSLVAVPGAETWRSPVARRFRYALVVGVVDLRSARRYPVVPAWQTSELDRGRQEPGLFGIVPVAVDGR